MAGGLGFLVIKKLRAAAKTREASAGLQDGNAETVPPPPE